MVRSFAYGSCRCVRCRRVPRAAVARPGRYRGACGAPGLVFVGGGAFWWITSDYARLPQVIGREPRVALVIDECDLATGEVRQVTARGQAEVMAFVPDRARRKLVRY